MTTMTVPGQLDVSATELTLHRPVEDLPAPVARAVVRWLRDHSIEPARVALGRPIRRDEVASSVSWREQTADGVTIRTRFPAIDPGQQWPAPFTDLMAHVRDASLATA